MFFFVLAEGKISNGDFEQYAAPFGKSTIDLLNQLSPSTVFEDDLDPAELRRLNLPEIYSLQGFGPMNVPSFRAAPQSYRFEDLMSTSFLRGDPVDLEGAFSRRSTLLIQLFK